MKIEAYKLYSGVFWIFLPNFIKIAPCNFELYRFKIKTFFLRHSLLGPKPWNSIQIFLYVFALIHFLDKRRLLWLSLDDWHGNKVSVYPVLSKLISYLLKLWRLCRFCVPKIIDIDQDLLKLFENIMGPVFLNHSVV